MIFNLKLPSPPPFATALSNAQSNVESVYGLGSDPATIFPSYIGAAEGTDAGNLGLILGAIINEDQHLCPSAPGGLVAALSLDLEDGVFNGAFPPGCDCASSPVPYCGGFLPEIAGTSDFQDALSGLAQAQLVTAPFAFGGTGNVLTANGLANLATGGSTAYPIAPLATINQALLNAAPFLSDSFLNPDSATMNSSRLVPTATLLPSGRVLIAGGKAADASVLNSTELHDPAANTFTTAAAMNTARDSATATLLPNGKVLIAGGLDSSFKPLASTELYDPVNNTFLAADPAVMNTARNTATATLLSNGEVLIAGGLDTSGSALASTDLYDPADNTFLAADPATMNTARSSATATLLPNGKVLIAGGQGGGVIGLASTELYNPANNTFLASDPATMTSGRAVATATLLTSGDVLIAGGFVISGDNNLTSTERYITATNTFLTSGNPTMNTARNAAMATLLPNGKVLIAGGDRSPPSVSRAPSCTIRSSTASHPPLS